MIHHLRKRLLPLAIAALTGVSPSAFAEESAPIRLEITEPGEVVAKGPEFKVKPNEAVNLRLTYSGRNLGRSLLRSGANTWLKITLVWLDADGKDVDIARAAQAFPPLKRVWEVADATGKPVGVAVNASAPGNAVKARLDFALLRDKPLAPASVEISGLTLSSGQVKETGIPIVVTGPPDAGPLGKQPEGVKFGVNLAPNAALEEGKEMPTGWRVIGDNSGGAAQWIDGGAYSGRRALRIDDRGPYVRSWDDPQAAELGVPGGKPTDNYGVAREEVAARWVSEPVPAEPGALYQTMAAIHYGNRHDPSKAIMNPVRIQFLDKAKRPIPQHPWVNGLPLEEQIPMLATPGWMPVVGNPVAAPGHAAFVCAVIALHHAYYETLDGPLNKVAMNPGFVVVDNVALFKSASARPAGDSELTKVHYQQSCRDTVAAGGLPFVPSSPAHRPNSLACGSHTPIGAGILEQGAGQPLGLLIRDRIGDRRELAASYELRDAGGKSIHAGETKGAVEPYGEAVIPLDVPADLPLGPYIIGYTLSEGGRVALEGATRMAVAAKPVGTLTEHRRMDYPFATWTGAFKRYFAQDPDRFHLMGRVLRYAGSGKNCAVVRPGTWSYVPIKDPVKRKTALNADIAEARRLIEAMNKYEIFAYPLMHETSYTSTKEDESVIREVVTAWVNGLADLALVWDHSDEPSAPSVPWELIDATTKADGSNLHVWGYKASARKYIEDYKIVYDAAHEAQPDVVFGFNTASSADANVVHNLVKLGAKFDMLGCNMFMNPFAIWTEKVKALKEYGLDEKIYLSGQNFGMAGAPADELEFAKWQTKYWVQMLQAFPMMAYAPEYVYGLEDNHLINAERVTPGWASYAAMTRMLGAGTFTAKHTFPGGEVYVRTRSHRPGIVGVAWATSGSPATVELAVGAGKVTVTDVWGNPRVVETDKGVLSLVLTDSPQYILDATKIEPAPSVRIELAQASMDAGKSRFTVTLRNEKPIAVGGVLKLDPQAAATVAPASITVEPIPAGESRSYTATLAIFDPTLDKPLPIKARFETDENNRAYETIQTMNFHFATQAKTAPKVDGFLDDWAAPDRLALVANREEQLFRYQNKGPWSGPDEFSGKLWMAWNARNLYLAARVRDAGQTFAKEPGDIWAGDSIELLIAPMGGHEKNSPYTQISFGLVEGDKPVVMRHAGVGASGPLAKAQVAVRRVDGGYVYEAAIPWSDLTDDKGFAPKSGHAITAVFSFNDKDGGTRMMGWFNHVTSKDPAKFGQIVLTGPIVDGVKYHPPENLVPNGDFDDPALPPADDLAPWRITFYPDKMGKIAGKAYLSREGARAGRSLVIERQQGGNCEVGGFNTPVEAGRRYLVRAMVKAPMSLPTVLLSFFGADGKGMATPLSPILLAPRTTWAYNSHLMFRADHLSEESERASFHPLAAVVDAPAGAARLRIGFLFNHADGKAYFDNIEVFALALPGGVK